jgi:catechol 2,3-dioxygenase-like lactoylglutathione lyase family enzyme
MTTPTLGSILLASTDPDRLRSWYEQAFGVSPNPDGFLEFGGVAILVDRRDDVAPRSAEPVRLMLNFHVADIHESVAHLDGLGVTWVSKLELRGDVWFAALEDPDGNVIQVIELTPAYVAERRSWSPADNLRRATIATRLPAQDLDRARRFYAEKLGLEPAEERPGGLRYTGSSGWFAVFESAGRPSGEHTQMSWEVDDLDAVVAELRRRGVTFEDYDLPGLTTVDGIATVEGNYPSKGAVGERGAWFRDSEGNLLSIGEPIRSPDAGH